MSSDEVFDLTGMMEAYIDSGMQEVEIMRELLKVAEEANLNSGYQHFRIGEDIYSMKQLEDIQQQEEHEVLFKSRH